MIIAKNWQRTEGGLIFLICAFLAMSTGYDIAWWGLLVVFFLPDISLAGYALGAKPGAVIYNLVHSYAGGVLLLVAGVITGNKQMLTWGALWLSHCGFDRMLGYGLKSPEGFQLTHLGRIGRPRD